MEMHNHCRFNDTPEKLVTQTFHATRYQSFDDTQ